MMTETIGTKTSYFKSSTMKLEIDTDIFFYENDNKLTSSDDDESFTKIDFDLRTQHVVSDFINQSFDNVVVLAGAGASVVVNEQGLDKRFGKTVEMISKNINTQLKTSNTLFTLQELATKSKYDICVEIDNVYNTKFNLEDFLSNVLTYEGFFEGSKDEFDKFKHTKEKILEIIKKDTSYSFDDKVMKHDTFLKVLSKKVKTPHKLSIITTNYDTLFEEAGANLGFTFIDGFTFSATPSFDSDMFEWNLVKEIPNVKTNELEYKANVVNLLKIHGSLTWEHFGKEKGIIRKSKKSVKIPIMIFPSSNKYAQSYEEPYFELFTKFQDLLKRPNTLLITVGFSFADIHISKMITSAIKSNTGLGVLITDHDIDQKHVNWKELDKLSENHFRVAFLKATLNNDLTDYLGGTNGNR